MLYSDVIFLKIFYPMGLEDGGEEFTLSQSGSVLFTIVQYVLHQELIYRPYIKADDRSIWIATNIQL